MVSLFFSDIIAALRAEFKNIFISLDSIAANASKTKFALKPILRSSSLLKRHSIFSFPEAEFSASSVVNSNLPDLILYMDFH